MANEIKDAEGKLELYQSQLDAAKTDTLTYTEEDKAWLQEQIRYYSTILYKSEVAATDIAEA